MGTIAEKLTYLNDTKTAIKNSIVAKGVSVSDSDTFRSYATKIGEISGGGAPATKFGATVDLFIGDADRYGVLQKPTAQNELEFLDVVQIAPYGLQYAFYFRTGITGVYFYTLTTIDPYGLYYAFYNSTDITSIDFSLLNYVDTYAMQNAFNGCKNITGHVYFGQLYQIGQTGMSSAFYGCSGITSVSLHKLIFVDSSGMGQAFNGCSGITSVDLSSLEQVDTYSMQSAFKGCSGLTKMSFPSLKFVEANSFGSSATTGTFSNCTGITEIHFRADAQSAIESMTTYSNKFGASNATIYFDLIGTITVNGVAYSRYEVDSLYVDEFSENTKTFVAWKDENDNIVYTNATAEPAVGTIVYSDEGMTQVGTVEGVA